MSYSRIFKQFAVAFLLVFALAACNYQTQNTDEGFVSTTLSSYMYNSFGEDGVRGFTQAGDIDINYLPEDLVSSKFKPLSEEEAYCVLTFKSNKPFVLSFPLGKMWDGILEYYPAIMTQDGWGLFTGSSCPASYKSDEDGYYYLYLRGEGNKTITYDKFLSHAVKKVSGIQFSQINSSTPLGDIECYGTIESLLDWKIVKNEKHPVMDAGAFQGLFANCTNLKVAPRITSPLTNTACYATMFAKSGIVSAPALPSKILTSSCYEQMFFGCESLQTLPELPAQTLAPSCYKGMFYNCHKVNIMQADSQPDGYKKYYIGPSSGVSESTTYMFGDPNNKITPEDGKLYYTKNSIITGSTDISRPMVVSSATPTDISDEVGVELLPFIKNSDINKYVCRPGNGGKIEFNLDKDYSVWYLFSDSTYEDHTIPGVNELKKSVTIISPQSNSVTDAVANNYNLKLNRNLNIATRNNYVEYSNTKSFDNIDTDDGIGEYNHNDVIKISYENFKKHFEGGLRREYDESDEIIYNTEDADTKDISSDDITSPLGDEVGARKWFYSYYYPEKKFIADCRLIKKVKVASGAEKYLVIYTNSSVSADNELSQDAIENYANYFLRDGLDNDVYDKMTDLFGSERGLMDAKYVEANARQNNSLAKNDFIDTKDTITIVFEPVPETAGVIAYVHNVDYMLNYRDSVTTGNNRCLIHANESYGNNFGVLSSTLAHEFQHILYFNNFYDYPEYRSKYGIGVLESYTAMTEFFSILSESYICDYIFGYTTPDGEQPGRVKGAVTQAFRGNSFTRLFGSDNVNIFNLVHGTDTYDNLYPYFSYLGHYVLSNYGKKVIREYFHGEVEGFDGLIAAINKVYPYANMTKTKLIADWQTAIMLSPINDRAITFPYCLRGGLSGLASSIWFLTNNVIAFGRFRDGMVLSTPLYYSPTYSTNSDELSPVALSYSGSGIALGFSKYTNSDPSTTKSNVATRLVKGNVPAGSTFKAIAPDLPENVMLTVVAVPHSMVL